MRRSRSASTSKPSGHEIVVDVETGEVRWGGKKLGHVVLYVADIDRSRHFYRDVLGFNEIDSGNGPAAVFSSGRSPS